MKFFARKFGRWNVRIVRIGEKYGPGNILTNDDAQLIEFYDSETETSNSLGKLVSGQIRKDLVESIDTEIPLHLYGDHTIPVEELKDIVGWLKQV